MTSHAAAVVARGMEQSAASVPARCASIITRAR